MKPSCAADNAQEAPLMTVWPSIGAWAAGRLVGGVMGNRLGLGPITLGRLGAVAMIPLALGLYAWRLMPFWACRYTLTSRRVCIQRGLCPAVSRASGLDEFDEIEIVVLAGQEWLRAGDLIFCREGREVFRLAGVSHPQAFRQTCLKARTALVSVRRVLEEQGVACGA